MDETTQEGWAVTIIIATIHLVSTGEPEKPADILTVDTGGHHDTRPLIAWTGSHSLHVTVPYPRSYVTSRTRTFDGVQIDIRLEVD